MVNPLPPNTTCYCGCGKPVTRGAYFHRGHDKIAEAALTAITTDQGEIARRLADAGYGPDTPVIYAAEQHGGWQRCDRRDNDGSGRQCWYAGRPVSVRAHQAKWHTVG